MKILSPAGAKFLFHRAWKSHQLHQQFRKEFVSFENQASGSSRFPEVRWTERAPYLHERTSTLSIEPHYLYHPAWAARVLAQTAPAFHIDIGSSLHWAMTVSAFVPVDYYEFRPPSVVPTHNFEARPGDLLNLPFREGSVSSLSCMHTIEHVGLGRFGDPLDYDGDLKAMAELKRVLAPDGDLLVVVPLGRPLIQFNSQRIYSYRMFSDYFSELELEEFMLILEDGSDCVFGEAAAKLADSQGNACGCFWFKRRTD